MNSYNLSFEQWVSLCEICLQLHNGPDRFVGRLRIAAFQNYLLTNYHLTYTEHLEQWTDRGTVEGEPHHITWFLLNI